MTFVTSQNGHIPVLSSNQCNYKTFRIIDDAFQTRLIAYESKLNANQIFAVSPYFKNIRN